MKLSFSFDPKVLMEKCEEQLIDIYDYINEKGFDHTFNWANYENNEVLISYYREDSPILPRVDPGYLFYVINFEKDESEIFIEKIADDICIYFNGYVTKDQDQLIENSDERISVSDLIKLNKSIPIDYLYGFCVDYIYPKDIFLWSIYMVLKDGDVKLVYSEEIKK